MKLKYTESEVQRRTRENNFTYHPPHGDQVQRFQALREHAEDLAIQLNTHCPPSRELSLAMTKLEEAVMWANAAIARNEADASRAPAEG